MKQCDTCIYGNKSEYEKPCIVYKGENCEIYKKRSDGMENKEALSLIESYLKSGYAHNADDFKQALEMAIKALRQEPNCPYYVIDDDGHGLCTNHRYIPTMYYPQVEGITPTVVKAEQEPCGDLISREMALKECHDIVVDGERYRVIQEETLLGLPPVKPQPKTGHWVEENINGLGRKVFCSECGCSPPFEHISSGDVYSASGYGVINKTKHCPNCGCRMVEPQESEDKE